MNGKLCDLVRFEIDRLFNGAVDVDWLQSDEAKASRAASLSEKDPTKIS